MKPCLNNRVIVADKKLTPVYDNSCLSYMKNVVESR